MEKDKKHHEKVNKILDNLPTAGKDLYDLEPLMDAMLGKAGTKKRQENRDRAELAFRLDDLREKRKEAGLSLNDLAEKMGVDKGYLSRIENGKTSPSLKTFCRYVEALGKRVEIV